MVNRPLESIDFAIAVILVFVLFCPKTHLEVKMLRKMWDVIASHRYALLEALEKCDLDRSGSVTARQFVYSLETVCGHEFRSSEMDWVREKLREIKSGNVNYNEFFDALNDHGSFTHSESDQLLDFNGPWEPP